MRGWLWYFTPNSNRFAKSSGKSNVEEILGLRNGVGCSDTSDSELSVETVFVLETVCEDVNEFSLSE